VPSGRQYADSVARHHAPINRTDVDSIPRAVRTRTAAGGRHSAAFPAPEQIDGVRIAPATTGRHSHEQLNGAATPAATLIVPVTMIAPTALVEAARWVAPESAQLIVDTPTMEISVISEALITEAPNNEACNNEACNNEACNNEAPNNEAGDVGALSVEHPVVEVVPTPVAGDVCTEAAESESPSIVDLWLSHRDQRPTRQEARGKKRRSGRAPRMADIRPDSTPEPARPPLKVRAAWWGATIAVALVVAFLLHTFVVQTFWIPSQSMEPTLHGCPGCNDDRILVSKLSYRLHSINRGDVVVFSRPKNLAVDDQYLIKRVIGLPGQTVSASGGVVHVGATTLREPYVNPACHGTADFSAVTVPKGRLFVMGDNRCDSSDSRVFGTIAESSVVGRAFVIVWPLKRLSWL
jgi:signal peptidase I